MILLSVRIARQPAKEVMSVLIKSGKFALCCDIANAKQYRVTIFLWGSDTTDEYVGGLDEVVRFHVINLLAKTSTGV